MSRSQDFDAEPTFEEFEAARRVIIYVRLELAAQSRAADGRGLARGMRRDPLALADSPIMAEIVMRSSPAFNPAFFERSHLGSAEGLFERSHRDREGAEG
jgi:hypothetical protein